jgi:hypothetical protein
LISDDIKIIVTAAVSEVGSVIPGCELLFCFDGIDEQLVDILWDNLIFSPNLYEFPEIFLVIATAQKVHVKF